MSIMAATQSTSSCPTRTSLRITGRCTVPKLLSLSQRATRKSTVHSLRSSPTQIIQRQSTARATQARATNGGGNDTRIPPQEFIYRFLTERQMKSVNAQVAFDLVATGNWEIVDVRPKDSHAEATPRGAKSAPLFQKVDWSKPSFVKMLRAGALMANGVTPVEPNPTFLEDLSEAAGGKNVILACEACSQAGGSIRPTSSFAFGKASRSLSAAYRALKSGTFESSQVLHLDGGVYGWYLAQLPFDGEFDTSNVGRTPNAAADAQYPVNVEK